jgi:hypothetical protein
MVTCELTGKRLLRDETEVSGITGKLVDKSLLKTSAISGTKGEAEHFGTCDFSKIDVLKTELESSEISGKSYRKDQQRQSVVSGKRGHSDEFITCSQTGQPLTFAESERCELTFKQVLPGILETCAVTGKRVLPTELERCDVTGKRAIRSLFVTSSLSSTHILKSEATRSTSGLFCAPSETVLCAWSDSRLHPADVCSCALTGLRISYQHARPILNGNALLPLVDLLEGTKRSNDKSELWPAVAQNVSAAIGNKRSRVEAAILSPNGILLAASLEVRTLLGLRSHKIGIVYSLDQYSLVGQIARPSKNGWS